MSSTNNQHYFLAGGSEMGELIRAKDWSKTSLGDPSTWPQCLCTMVAVMLDNPFGMYIAWGDDYTQIYNDAYRPILGSTKHPQALGISTRETFSEIWDIIGSMFDDVMKGKATGFPDFMLPLNRNGYVEECFFDFSYSPIRKENGEVGGVLVTVIETTEKKIATDALKVSNERFVKNIMQAPVAMCIFRGKNHIVEIANEHMLELWGKSAEEVMNKPIFEGLPEAKDQGLEYLIDTVFATGVKFEANERPIQLPRNGKIETKYLNFVYEALKEANGDISGIIAIAVEVTEQVLSRSKVEESENKIRAIIENAPFAIGVYTGEEMKIEFANESIINIWGKGLDVIGKSFMEILPELNGQLIFEQIKDVYRTGKPFHSESTPLDLIVDGKLGTYYFNYNFTPLYDLKGNIYGVMNTGVDLTALNIAKKTIEESEQNLRSMVLQSPIGICVLDASTLISEIVNDSFVEVAGKPYEEISGKYYWDTFKEVKEEYEPKLQEVIETGEAYYANEVKLMLIRHGKEENIYVTFVYAPLKNINGNVKKIVVWVLDNTQQVITRQKIEEADKRFRDTVKQAPLGIAILRGSNYIVEMANETYLKLVDRQEKEFLGKPLFQSLPEVEESVGLLLDGVLKTGIPYHGNEAAIPIHRFGKTTISYFDFLYHPLKEDDGEISGIIVTATEVTEKVESRKKIEQNEERLNLVIDASELGTWELNVKTKVPKYSKKYLEIIGGYKEEVVLTHQQILAHLHPDDMDLRDVAFNQALATGYLQYEARVIWLDKSIHWMEGKGKVFYDNEKNPIKLIGTIRDITDIKKHQQKIEDSEKQFRSLAESLPQLIWETDEKGNALFTSGRWKEYTGINPLGELEWRAIIHPDDIEQNAIIWKHSLDTGETYKCDVRIKDIHGNYRWHAIIGEPVLDKEKNITKWVGAFTDIHTEKAFTHELELQVAKRTLELEQTNLDLERINKELQSFNYISSHDMQEPLRKIQTFASQILETESQNLSDRGKDKFLRMQKAANRMQELINDLLSYSKANLQERIFEKSDLNTIIEEVKIDLKEELEQKHAIIECGNVCELNIIPFQFRQLIYNLVSNSLKFSKPNITPIIKIKSELKKGVTLNNPKFNKETNYCHISISDNGIGFDQHYNQKIFDVFQRLHGKSEYKGTGIGLAIVKKIVENHHGFVEAKGELNIGATFDIYIPIV